MCNRPRKCADLIQDQDLKDIAQVRIAEYQAELGDIAGAQKTSDVIKVPSYISQGLIAIAKAKIKGGVFSDAKNLCRQINAAPEYFYYLLHETAKKIIKVQIIITGMLKQEAKK